MSRTTVLRRTRTVAVASLIAAAAFSLTACGGGESDSDAKGGSASATASGTSGGSGGSGDSTGGSGEGIDAKAGGASGGSSSASRCTTGHLEATWSNFEGGPDMTYDRQQTARVVLKNTGSSACTMVGFPGVQLQAEHGETWDLRRTDDKPKPVRVEAGGRVTFDITFLASTRDDDKKFAPDQVVITPPNDRRNISLDWPYGGALLDQSGATHPGTFVGPVSTPE